jgi:DNA polymerase-1
VTAKPTLLIDGDGILYRSAAAAEKETHWGDDLWSLTSDLREAKSAVNQIIQDYIANYNGLVVLCFNDRTANFRKDVDPTYKAGRSRKPLGYWALRDWAEEEWECVSLPRLEADDVMGILATNDTYEYPVIVSPDKDMKTIPCRLIRGDGELLVISEAEADYWHMFQTLVGDITDGFKGCPGVGVVTAEKLLLGKADLWSVVVSQFIKAKQTEQEALTQARLARILRAEDWDHEKQEVKLWVPRSPA